MIVSINQPAYIPWLGYFDRIDASDLHIVLDHVQFEKNSLVNRNRIRTPKGWMWLTIPLATKGNFGNLPISNLRYADSGRWRDKHWKAISMNYARASHYAEHQDTLKEMYGNDDDNMFLPCAMRMNHYIARALGVDTPQESSSAMGVEGTKSELVLNLCQAAGAKTYLSGPFGRHYLDLAAFESAGIDVVFHDYRPQPYDQAWPGFEPAMSSLDVLVCSGGSQAADSMRAGRNLSDDPRIDGETYA